MYHATAETCVSANESSTQAETRSLSSRRSAGSFLSGGRVVGADSESQQFSTVIRENLTQSAESNDLTSCLAAEGESEPPNGMPSDLNSAHGSRANSALSGAGYPLSISETIDGGTETASTSRQTSMINQIAEPL